MLVPRENAMYVAEPIPHLVLVAPPGLETLPPLTLRDGVVGRCDGWNLFARLTVSVVDGPGDAGFMVPGATDEQEAERLAPRLDAVQRAGAAVVIGLPAHPSDPSLESLVSAPGVRGGTVPAVESA
ncbi:hypothetical protein E1293_46895 [Actinomadura darangshiensis]|uniref:Uncharacterized protein n=1 Tax=Actinomadura darangshiensis TaxID=705336 RepID=A0A4R4ZJ01_9ACTN|nr:hypothetical protein [Actinomadura darangshiensis]TDD58583.1 hypothetical protein E1293_46895 [Actinomadura darangshiensis]